MPSSQFVLRGSALTFPHIMEAELLRPDTNHSPAIKQDDANGDGIEHSFGREAPAFLNLPKGEDAHSLGCYANDEQIRKIQSVVRHD
jgi:hypothetical protein